MPGTCSRNGRARVQQLLPGLRDWDGMELNTLPCPGLKNNLGRVKSAAEDPGSPCARGVQIQWFIYCCCSC